MKTSREYLQLLACLLLALVAMPLIAQEEVPPARPIVPIPLHVHILQSETLPDAHCTLTDEDIQRIVRKVNDIWSHAGVRFDLAGIVRENASRVDAFIAERGDNPSATLRTYRMLIPDESRKAPGMHVYYVRDLPVNGVYLNQNLAMVKQTARLREVEGGIDEPLPRVTAHELGHALGLLHRQARTNLMASGTTGTSLSPAEIERARENAVKVKAAPPT